MARPVKKRNICALPTTREFCPKGGGDGEAVVLGVDEFETVRLIDHLQLTQDECAAQMQVARTTVQAMYNAARVKVADALVNGKRLVITGGSYTLCSRAQNCCGKNCVHCNCACCQGGASCGCGCGCEKA